MRLERLNIKVEVAIFDNYKVITRVHGACDEYLGSDVI